MEQIQILKLSTNLRRYTYTHQVFIKIFTKKKKCFTNYISIKKIPNVLNEENADVVIEEKLNNEDFKKSDIEIETYETIEKLKYPQEYNSKKPISIILDDINQKEMNDSRVQAMFKRSHRNNISTFIKGQG